jgi:hypothetical protein
MIKKQTHSYQNIDPKTKKRRHHREPGFNSFTAFNIQYSLIDPFRYRNTAVLIDYRLILLRVSLVYE